ncbi:hypothetical protein MF271_05440 [Deinococcus sp. KNUC1210]|uniref:hypothetical protein n=1 Tax=Deinococcus sp. KNUC1210 TaxID=2917691 RepID=UPI001EF0AC17|nr:hypothetical protein [Deinococcus sp. KNUC1210]ULH16078.1 hypothetical protein MF271_05440 [Deinococcus sp. KNUC1210]
MPRPAFLPCLLLAGALLCAPPAAALAPPPAPPTTPSSVPIFVAYPAAGAKVAFDHVIFEGSVLPGASLSVNGRALDVGPDGLFMEWLPLNPGTNDLLLRSVLGGQTSTLSFRVVSAPAAPLPLSPPASCPLRRCRMAAGFATACSLSGWKIAA